MCSRCRALLARFRQNNLTKNHRCSPSSTRLHHCDSTFRCCKALWNFRHATRSSSLRRLHWQAQWHRSHLLVHSPSKMPRRLLAWSLHNSFAPARQLHTVVLHRMSTCNPALLHLELLNTCAPQWQVANSLAATTCHTDRAMCAQQMHSTLRPHMKACFHCGAQFRVASMC